MLEQLKQQVCEANCLLPAYDLVTFTWGNVSAIDRESGMVVIKPSGVAYEDLTPEMMVVLDLEGHTVEGTLNPSSDTPTHLELYRAFPEIGAVVHTHSPYATSFAQAMREIPAYGTTHADYFYGAVPCTRVLTQTEVESAYELCTGKVIVETFRERDENAIPGVLVANHGPFCWGKDAKTAVYHAKVLEEVAKMALWTQQNNPAIEAISPYILDKHYLRKHGKNAYYGQNAPLS